MDFINSTNFGVGVLATTYGTYYTNNGHMAESDIAFNRGWNWEYQTNRDCDFDADISFTEVAIHELGHAFGLMHEDDVPCVMNTFNDPTKGLGPNQIVVPNADDVKGVRVLYFKPFDFPLIVELSAGNSFQTKISNRTPIMVPTTARTGGKVPLKFAVHNRGNSNANGVKVGFYLSQNSTISPSDRLIHSFTLNSLALGRVSQGEVALVIPKNVSPGIYHLGYYVDPEDLVKEGRNYDNASGFCRSQIRITDATPPEITIQKPAAGSIFGPGKASLKWRATDNDKVTQVSLAYSTDGGGTWKVISNNTANDGSYNWAIPTNLNSDNVRVRVSGKDPSGNTASKQSGRFTVDQKSPELTLYFASDMYLRQHFDLILFSNEELMAALGAVLASGDDQSAVEMVEVDKDPLQYRAPLELSPGIAYRLQITGRDGVGNETRTSRNLVAGAVGAGAGSKLYLGPVALGSGKNSGKSSNEHLLFIDGVGSKGRTIVNSGVSVWWTENDPVVQVWPAERLGQDYELTWQVDVDSGRLNSYEPVVLKSADGGQFTIVTGSWDFEKKILRHQIDSGGEYRMGYVDKGLAPNIVARTILLPNHPNPFNPETTIKFSLQQSGSVKLEIYDIKGLLIRTLVNDQLGSGPHQVVWRGRNRFGEGVASGTYFYRLTTGGAVQTRKMLLLK